MTQRVSALHHIIAQQRHAGLAPQEIHCNAVTRDSFVREAGIVPKASPDTRSPLQRLMGSGTPPESILEFDDVRLVTNNDVQGGAIIIRPAQLMADPLWLQKIVFKPADQQEAAKAQQTAGGSTPWHQRVEDAHPGDDSTSTEALTRGGGVNCTTVILKAMEDLDKIEDVIVLRFYRNKSIDLCSTLNQFGVVGALQKALGHVMNGDD